MADDRSAQGKRDSSRVAAGEDDEVEYLAKKHNLTRQQVLDLVSQHGNDRAKLEEEAAKISGGGPA